MSHTVSETHQITKLPNEGRVIRKLLKFAYKSPERILLSVLVCVLKGERSLQPLSHGLVAGCDIRPQPLFDVLKVHEDASNHSLVLVVLWREIIAHRIPTRCLP